MAELLAGRRNRKPRFQSNNVAIQKLVQQTGQFGNKGIKNQQITHRHLYHYLPLDGVTTFNFFKNVKNATELFSNINENKLEVGEAMIIKEMFFDIITTEGAFDPPKITTQTDFQTAGFSGLYASQLQWTNDNSRVVKPIGLQQMNPKFNRNAFNASLNCITLKSDITIQTLIQFIATLSTPTYVAAQNTFVGMHTVGIGMILSPKKNF